jgi:hypothetical protein
MLNIIYYKYLKYKQKYLQEKLLNKTDEDNMTNFNPATTHPASIKSI